MQTTLLGLAIAAILALVTALVGPAFVDWGRYRSNFEVEAARMTGQPVRIGGAIDVRILPSPIIVLHDVEVGSRAAPVFGAQMVRIELALDGLMRGELRAAAVALNGPEFSVALDRNGRLVSRLSALGFDPERVSVDRLAIIDGRLLLEDAASGVRATLDKVDFGGDVRPQSGQVRGDGTFTIAGHGYRYQVTTGRRDAATRLRLNLEPVDRPLSFEAEGALTFDADAPRFEGTASLVRPAGVVLANGEATSNEPWRVAGHVRVDADSAVFEQVEAQYGPDERRIQLGGTAEFKFGAQPHFESALSARQIDLDRTLAARASASQPPVLAMTELFDSIAGVPHPPFPAKIGIGVDSVTFGGAILQSVHADISAAPNGWNIDTFEFRAPGATQVRLSGRIGGKPGAAEFSGPLAIDSTDPGVSVAWLQGTERPKSVIGALRFTSDVTVDSRHVAFEHVAAEIDRKPLEGRLAYTYPSEGRRAWLDVAVKARELDVDAAHRMVSALLAGSKAERPGEMTLALDLGRATFAGFTAVSANANLRLDSSGLRIEKLSIADFGGAALSGSGEIDIAATQPHGTIALSLAAPKLDGIAAVAERFWPGTGAVLMRNSARLVPARIDTTLNVKPQGGAAGDAVAQLSLNGQLGNLHLAVSGEGTGNAAALRTSDLKLEMRVNSDDASLVSVLGLDALAPASERQPASLAVTAARSAGGELRIDAKLAADGLAATGTGTVASLDTTPAGVFQTSFASTDLRALRRPSDAAFPVSLKSTVRISGKAFDFTAIDGNAAGSAVRGRVLFSLNKDSADVLALDRGINIEGKLALDSIDAAAVLATMTGVPAASPGKQTGAWPAAQFAPTSFSDLRGHVDIEAARVNLLPSVEAQKMRGAVGFSATEIIFDNVTASIGSGEASAQARLTRAAGGFTLRGKVALSKVDATNLIRIAGQTPVGGRVSGDLSFESTGTSPAALVAGLQGAGVMTLENGKIAGVNRDAINAAADVAERANAIVPQQVTDAVSRALDNASLTLPSASGAVELVNGRLRLGRLVTPGVDDATISATLDLLEQTVDARFSLLGPAAGAVQGLRPELSVLYKGPVAAPRRTVDVAALTSWLTLRSVERASKKVEVEEREAKRREQFEAAMREQAREREAARERAAVPAVTGTAAPLEAASSANAPAPRHALPPPTGLFAPVLPAPQLIPNEPPKAGTMLTAPPLPAPTVIPQAGVTAVPTARIAPAQEPPMPPSDTKEAELPNPESLPVNPPLPQRRPAQSTGPLDLAPRAPAGYGSIQQHNAPQ